MDLSEPCRDAAQIRLRLRHCSPGLQAADGVDAGVNLAQPGRGFIPLTKERVDIRRAAIFKPSGYDTDDREILAVQRQRFADDLGARSKPPLPQSSADHRHRARADVILLAIKVPAEDWRNTEDCKEIRGDALSTDVLGFTYTGQVQALPIESSQAFKRVILVLPVYKVRIGERRHVVLRDFFAERHQPDRVLEGERLVEQAVHHAEDRAVRDDD